MTTREKRRLVRRCIRDFYMKQFVKLSKDARDLGLERGLECCYELFEEGTLKIKVEDIDNYIVYSLDDQELQLIFDKQKEIPSERS